MKTKLLSIGIGIFFIFLGIIVNNILKAAKKNIPVKDITRRKIIVNVAQFKPIDKGINIIGYGNVISKKVLTITTEVSGKIVFLNEDFLQGKIIRKGDIIAEIEKDDYIIAKNKAKANLKLSLVNIKLLKQQEKNIKESIKIAKKNVELAYKEWKRYDTLVKEKSASYSDLTRFEMQYQSALSSLTSLQNELNLIPIKIEQTRRNIELLKENLAQAKLNLRRTKIYAPFTGRVLSKEVEVGEFVNKGRVIGKMYDINDLEVKVPLGINDIKWILPEYYKAFVDLDTQIDFPEQTGKVKIYPTYKNSNIWWDGEIVRLGPTINKNTRTIDVYVKIEARKDFSILQDMFVKVEFEGIILKNVYKIPRYLISNENTINVEENGKLRIKPVNIVYIYKDYAYIDKGIDIQDKVITTVLENYVNGMELKVINRNFNINHK